jgi:lipopolysaccharide heptosyltransferase I
MMKRVLLIKFTSLGDLIHALPALTDAARAHPGLKFDWMIDESFSEIATWHESVERVFATSHRTWRQGLLAALRPIGRLIGNVRETKYDLVIDGQGNFKTALMSLFTRGTTAGFDFRSVRERVASFAYRKKYPVSKKAHAIDRLRQLFAQSLDYPCPASPPDFGIHRSTFAPLPFAAAEPYIVFIPNASWKTKIWPTEHGKKLIELINQRGYTVYIPWGNEEEKERASSLAVSPLAICLPKLTLSEIGSLLAGAAAAVSMDTGLSHLSAALDVPTVTLYGATDSGLIGASGANQVHLISKLPCAPCNQKSCRFTTGNPPCLAELTPERVFGQLWEMLEPAVHEKNNRTRTFKNQL